MAFDQTSIAKDLRPINVVRTVTEDPRIPVATTTGRPLEGPFPNSVHETGSPGSVPVFYPATVSDTGFVVAGYGNQFPGVTARCSRPPAPLGHVGMNPVGGFGYSPNLGNRVVPNAADQFSSEMVGGYGYDQGLGSGDSANGSGRLNIEVTNKNLCNPNLGTQNNGNAADVGSEEGGDNSVSGKKVKFLCSFGGKIMPRPSDGMLRYVGGQTRIISVRREVRFNELMQRMVDTYGQPVVIKYQLPGEDLDALVSISCPDDLDNMMEEYEKLTERSSDGSAKLRMFLFSASEFDPSGVAHFGDLLGSGQRYVEAVNGVIDAVSGRITRKESIASASSPQNSDFSGTEGFERSALSPQEDLVISLDNADRTLPVDPSSTAYAMQVGVPVIKLDPPQSEVVMSEKSVPPTIRQQQQLLGRELQQTRIPSSAHYPQAYVDPQVEISRQPDYVHPPPQTGFPNPHLLGAAGPTFTQQPFHGNAMSVSSSHQFCPPVHMTLNPSSHHVGVRSVIMQPIVPSQETRSDYPDESTNLRAPGVLQLPVDQSYNTTYQAQIAPGVVSGGYGLHQNAPSDHVIFSDGVLSHQQVIASEKFRSLEDCHMCHKALPHAHSDPVAQERRDGSGSSVPISTSAYHSFHPDDAMRVQQLNKFMGQPKVSSNMDLQVGTPQYEAVGFSNNIETQYELERNALHKNSAGAAQVQASEPPLQETLKENLSKIPGVLQKRNNMDPSDSIEHTRQIGGLIENLHKCSPDIHPSGENHMPPTREEEVLESRSQQIGGRDMFSNTTFSQSSVILGTKYMKPAKILSNKRVEVPSLCDSRPMESSGLVQSLFLVNGGLYPSSAVGPQQVNSVESPHAADREPVIDWMNDVSESQAKVFFTDAQAVAMNVNLPSSFLLSNRAGDVQDSSDSLFSNQDPWNLQHDIHPPKPIKIQARKEALKAHEAFENHYAMGEIPNSEKPLQDEIFQSLWNANKEYSSKGSEEEHIKQELKDVAEGVAASVFDSNTPSYPELPAQMDKSASDANREEVARDDVDNQHTTYLEDIRTKLPERLNFSFPVSDRLGRLQIIKDSDLEELRELGSGTFGTVYHGKWRGTDVAIKRINDRCFAGKPSEQERMIDDFWNEAIKLADLHHPNVVAFYGVVLDAPGGSVATLTEYMVNGSLRNALQKSIRNIDKRRRLLIAMDVAFGMEYLHGRNIVHFDLKSDNLLVNLRDPHRPICKVGDLGLSKVKCQTLISGGVRGTLPWMAPELLNGSSSLVSEKVDVFSFGIVMWELLTGEEPYADLHYGVIIGGIVSNTLRPTIPESCDQDWKSLMERCWSAEPSERPSFTVIANELRSMAAKLPSKGQVASQPQP